MSFQRDRGSSVDGPRGPWFTPTRATFTHSQEEVNMPSIVGGNARLRRTNIEEEGAYQSRRLFYRKSRRFIDIRAATS